MRVGLTPQPARHAGSSAGACPLIVWRQAVSPSPTTARESGVLPRWSQTRSRQPGSPLPCALLVAVCPQELPALVLFIFGRRHFFTLPIIEMREFGSVLKDHIRLFAEVLGHYQDLLVLSVAQ